VRESGENEKGGSDNKKTTKTIRGALRARELRET